MNYLKYFDDGGSATVEGYEPMEGSQVNGGGTVDRLQKFYRGYFPPGTKERILEMISPKKALERRRERKAEEERRRQMEELEKNWIREPEPGPTQTDFGGSGEYGPLPEGVYEAAKGGNLKNNNYMAGKYGKGGYIEYFQTGGTPGQRDTTVTSGGGRKPTLEDLMISYTPGSENQDLQKSLNINSALKVGDYVNAMNADRRMYDEARKKAQEIVENGQSSLDKRIREYDNASKSLYVNNGGGYETSGGSEEYACGGKASRKQYGGGLNADVEHSDGELRKVVKQADMLMKKAVSNGEYDGDRWQYMSPKFVWREKLYRLIKDYPELYERYDMENSGNY